MKSDELKNITSKEEEKVEAPAAESIEEKQDSHPPGVLKWSQDEEERKQKEEENKEKIEEKEQKEEKEKKEEKENRIHSLLDHNVEKVEHTTNIQSEQDSNHSPSQQASTSIEDTLTPMGFQDYTSSNSHAKESEKQEEPQEEEAKKPLSASLLQLLWIPALLFVMLVIGVMIGYSVLGEQPVGEVFDLKTWEHLYNLVFSK